MKIWLHKSLLFVILLVCGVSLAFSVSDSGHDVFHVPKVEGLTIDGDGSDWESRGFLVAILTDPDGKILPAEDFDVRFRLAWDAQGLYVLANVQDDIAMEQGSLSRLWRESSQLDARFGQPKNRGGLCCGVDASMEKFGNRTRQRFKNRLPVRGKR
jgi:hypothetical protein